MSSLVPPAWILRAPQLKLSDRRCLTALRHPRYGNRRPLFSAAWQVTQGIVLVANVSPGPRFTETPELSLALSTAEGQLLVVGCSHPGIEQILSSIKAREKPVRMVMGGLHLVTTADAEVDRLAIALRDEWKLRAVAPGHCTGEYAFATLSKVFGPDYTYAGVGSVVRVP